MKRKRRAVRPENWAALLYFGEALKHWGKTGDASKLKRSVMSVDNIADCLIAIARGHDAGEVFRQHKGPGRQTLGWYHTAIVFSYWQSRVSPPHSHRDGLAAARQRAENIRAAYPGIPAISDDSITRYARELQDATFWHLENNEQNSVDLTPLRAALARRSKGSPRGKRTRI